MPDFTLFPPGHVRLTPIPDALVRYEAASPREQMRRVRFTLEKVRSLYRRRFSTLWGALEFSLRASGRYPAATEAARRQLRAVAGSLDLRTWERQRSRAEVLSALNPLCQRE